MNLKVQISIFLLAILLISLEVFGQSRKELEQEREQLNRQISTTQRLLKKTGGSKQQSLSSLETLQAQMESRRQLFQIISGIWNSVRIGCVSSMTPLLIWKSNFS